MHVIDIQNLTLAYNRRLVLQDFSAHISTGEFIGIFGPNGAGKSTLLQAILGLIKPLQGKVTVFGNPVKRGNPAIGYLPQVRQTLLSNNQLSGRTRIGLTLEGYRWGFPWMTKQRKATVDWAIHQVAAEAYADRPFHKLSGGERQRLLLAQALLGKPKILLLDEPLTNLDPQHQESLIELIQSIRKQLNISVLFTAHDVNPLLGKMDRVIYLARSKGVIGSVNQIINSENLSWLYGLPIEVIQHGNQLLVINKNSGNYINDTSCHLHE